MWENDVLEGIERAACCVEVDGVARKLAEELSFWGPCVVLGPLLSSNLGTHDIAVPWMLVVGGNACRWSSYFAGASCWWCIWLHPASCVCAGGTTGKALVAEEVGRCARSQKLLLCCMYMPR